MSILNRLLSLFVSAMVFLVLAGCRTADLADVEKAVPGVVLDIRYATTNNFTGQKLYPVAKCVLRRQTVEKLRAVQSYVAELGLGLKIFDGYRPLSVQKKMWAIFPNEDYVANPSKGSRPCRQRSVILWREARQTSTARITTSVIPRFKPSPAMSATWPSMSAQKGTPRYSITKA